MRGLSRPRTSWHHGRMDDGLWVLSESERDLVRETEAERLAMLDEDELLALHKRVRRARTKHTTNYRRKAAKQVEAEGARAVAHAGGAKSRLRAEVFEETLSVVSRELAARAHESAEVLKRERLAAAQAGRGTGPESAQPGEGRVVDAGRARSHEKNAGGLKRDASTASQGAQSQAKRDNRP